MRGRKPQKYLEKPLMTIIQLLGPEKNWFMKNTKAKSHDTVPLIVPYSIHLGLWERVSVCLSNQSTWFAYQSNSLRGRVMCMYHRVFTQSGNGQFLAYISSWWKISPEGEGCKPTHLHSSYHHIQSCSVRSSRKGRYTTPISSLYPYMYILCGMYNSA